VRNDDRYELSPIVQLRPASSTSPCCCGVGAASKEPGGDDERQLVYLSRVAQTMHICSAVFNVGVGADLLGTRAGRVFGIDRQDFVCLFQGG
jgi:hypothetical protein